MSQGLIWPSRHQVTHAVIFSTIIVSDIKEQGYLSFTSSALSVIMCGAVVMCMLIHEAKLARMLAACATTRPPAP